VDAVRAAAAAVVALSEDGGDLELLAERGYAPEQVAAWSRFPLSTRVPLSDAVRSGEMVIVPSVEERHRRYPELARIPALYPFSLSVPFVSEGEPLGAMGLSFREPPALEEEDRAFVTALARQCAQALRRARFYDVERRARAEAEAASRAKSVFLATMSHEIRTPINAVMGYADLLELGLQGTLTEGQLGYVGRIRASSRHLLGLVNDVLDFARVEAGETTVSAEPVPLAEAVADAAGMVLPLASSRGVALVEEPCDPAAACVGDPDRVRQILLNLLSNAVKFTRPGGRVIVRCRPAAEGEAASVEVEDTGIGIAAEHLERIFEPFTQVDESHTREAGGTGLGLAISRRFAVLMGGELTARSQPGTGSVFILRLPATRAAAPAPAATEPGAGRDAGDAVLAAVGRAL
jgi:signal transduction histidine kinase